MISKTHLTIKQLRLTHTHTTKQRYLAGEMSAEQYLAAYGGRDPPVQRHRRVRVLLDRMGGCRVENCDASVCTCPDGFVAQVRVLGYAPCLCLLPVSLCLCLVVCLCETEREMFGLQ